MEAIIEVLLPVNYIAGDKVTDKIISNLKYIYCDIVLTHKPTGKYSNLIILNSFIPHMDNILDVYPPEKTWYYMYDMEWGAEWYENHKDRLQLISDKPYKGSRFIIPNGMMELNNITKPTMGSRFGKLCIMESYKSGRFSQYDKYLQSYSLDIDVIGTTMNNSYKHPCNKIDSVPYEKLPELLQHYSYCLILWDKPHDSYNLPIKIAECLQNGVIPILVKEYGSDHPFPIVDSVMDIISVINKLKGHETNYVYNCIDYYKSSINMVEIKRSAQLIETDELYLKELERLLVWGRTKHNGHYWRENLDVKDFIEALKRHLNRYESGEEIDPETGISHLVAIGANAMFKRRIDKENGYDKE